MARILHTGDTHIGYQQYHSPERRRDFLEAFERVIADAVEMNVDAVVHAGDLFQDRRPDLPDIQGVVGALRRLRDAKIPFLAVVGNHEDKRDQQWLDLLAELGLAERLDDHPRVVGELALYGLDYVPPSLRSELRYEFTPTEAEYAALVTHGLFEPFEGGDWNPQTIIDTAPVAFDALLLGDNHTPGKRQVADTWLTYPGSTERASASEREPRGYNLITIDDGIQISRRTIPTRPFEFVDVTLEPGEGASQIKRHLKERDLTDAVVIVTIEGDGQPVTPGPLEELARERGAMIARVNDRRELDTETTTRDVTFADPDAAVEARLADRSLSAAARDVDRTVRDQAIADSNVRQTVRRRVDEHLQEGLTAFEQAPTTEQETAEQSQASPEQTTEAQPTDTTDTDTSQSTTASDSDQQASMEEYL